MLDFAFGLYTIHQRDDPPHHSKSFATSLFLTHILLIFRKSTQTQPLARSVFEAQIIEESYWPPEDEEFPELVGNDYEVVVYSPTSLSFH
ncbi:hypothetical protein Pyn_33324 [Prunus yedoensis var. nudiflora]|uniref:Uncharacterized protein n=1 Tax=Prunus yedoensis var. nudiflora TaxID=2094558 RepID=A0A314UYI8_PRUYE|nr:hypothetical protein Pyn_33324 [Prunus yedoensis var. nudiflora]